MANVLDVITWMMLSLGGLVMLIGGIGILRMPDFYSRLHPASITDTLASLLILGGIVLQAGWSLASLKIAAILLFLLFTNPAASYALANAAWTAGLRPETKINNKE